MLVALAKADLGRRLAAGERVAAADYLDACPALCADADLVLSLIYEEYCLREEAGEAPDPDSFCDRYEPWADSLASQLRYHRVLSQAAGLAAGAAAVPRPRRVVPLLPAPSRSSARAAPPGSTSPSTRTSATSPAP